MKRIGARVSTQHASDQSAVGHRPFVKGNLRRHGRPISGGEVVQHHRPAPLVEQFQHGMTADIAGAAGDEDRSGHQAGALVDSAGARRAARATPGRAWTAASTSPARDRGSVTMVINFL